MRICAPFPPPDSLPILVNKQTSFIFSVGSNRPPYNSYITEVLKMSLTFFKDSHQIKGIIRNSVSLLAKSLLPFEYFFMWVGCIATWLRVAQLRDRFSIPGKSKWLFSSLRQSKPAPNPPTFPFSVYWYIGGFSQGLKCPRRESNHSFPSSIKVQNEKTYTSMAFKRNVLRVLIIYTVFRKHLIQKSFNISRDYEQ